MNRQDEQKRLLDTLHREVNFFLSFIFYSLYQILYDILYNIYNNLLNVHFRFIY